MSRRKRTYKREIIPDAIFQDIVITKFINKMMYSGKKSTAQTLFYGALEELKDKIPGEEPISVFRKAVENCKPSIEVRSRRVGGATYQVPVDVRPTRRLALSMKWLIEYSRSRGEKDFAKTSRGRSFWTLTTVVAMRLKSVKMFIRWLNRIRHSPTTTGEFLTITDDFFVARFPRVLSYASVACFAKSSRSRQKICSYAVFFGGLASLAFCTLASLAFCTLASLAFCTLASLAYFCALASLAYFCALALLL